MKYGQRCVIDLLVFNENGKLVANLNTLKNSEIVTNSSNAFLFARDALLNDDILKFIGSSVVSEGSDFDKYINTNKFSTVIKFKKKTTKKCKLIATCYLRREDTGEDVEYIIEIPNAEINTGIDYEVSGVDVSVFDLFFNILPYNDEDELYILRIK